MTFKFFVCVFLTQNMIRLEITWTAYKHIHVSIQLRQVGYTKCINSQIGSVAQSQAQRGQHTVMARSCIKCINSQIGSVAECVLAVISRSKFHQCPVELWAVRQLSLNKIYWHRMFKSSYTYSVKYYLCGFRYLVTTPPSATFWNIVKSHDLQGANHWM